MQMTSILTISREAWGFGIFTFVAILIYELTVAPYFATIIDTEGAQATSFFGNLQRAVLQVLGFTSTSSAVSTLGGLAVLAGISIVARATRISEASNILVYSSLTMMSVIGINYAVWNFVNFLTLFVPELSFLAPIAIFILLSLVLLYYAHAINFVRLE